MFFRPATLVVKNIIIINVIMLLAAFVFGDPFYKLFAGHYPTSDLFQIWQLITHMFMHGGLGHLFFNMFGVYLFGSYLEQYWGAKRFLIYYMLTGFGAFALHFLVVYLRMNHFEGMLTPDQINEVYVRGLELLNTNMNFRNEAMGNLNMLLNGSVVGASGALFGLIIGFGLLFPNVKLMLLFPPIPIKARTLALGYGALELFMAFQNPGDNVAHFAHLGGMLFGYIILKVWQKQGKIP